MLRKQLHRWATCRRWNLLKDAHFFLIYQLEYFDWILKNLYVMKEK